MRLRSLIAKPVRWLVAKAGYDLVPLNAFDLVPLDAFGHDPFRDIRLLNEKWNSSVRALFDVGANYGGTSLKAVKQFPEAQIFAFEPHPETFLRLTDTTRHYSAIHPVQKALGAEAGDQVMYTYGSSGVINSLVPNAQAVVRFRLEQSSPVTVKCTTVDLFCAEQKIKKIDVLKIDTEGFDLEVLRGADAMLKRGAISFIYFEFNDIQPDENSAGGALAPIDEFLRRHQYRFIASYNDWIETNGDLFAVSNALYALPPDALPPRCSMTVHP
jgi:FkbM family methyltransferase